MKQIVSAVPGRLRVKDSRFGSAEVAENFAQRLKSMATNDKELKVRINAEAASVIVQYDAGLIALSDVITQVEGLLEIRTGQPSLQRRRRSRRMRVNRYAKIGALASLAVSMGFAAVDHKRLHVIAGMAFLAFLSAHLIVFRRTLTH